ncbi:MAG: AAA family ATPase, partial [Alphaproteobacteria bacterium]|nr:AAA family ATPase [Alphaproteobacteria bacterium]
MSMFFDQFKKNAKSAPASNGPDRSPKGTGGLQPAPRHAALPVGELRKTIDPASFSFASTAELEPAVGLIGQERALKAIDFGVNMEAQDFNIFVLGLPASG